MVKNVVVLCRSTE